MLTSDIPALMLIYKISWKENLYLTIDLTYRDDIGFCLYKKCIVYQIFKHLPLLLPRNLWWKFVTDWQTDQNTKVKQYTPLSRGFKYKRNCIIELRFILTSSSKPAWSMALGGLLEVKMPPLWGLLMGVTGFSILKEPDPRGSVETCSRFN